jgi:4-hydroxy-tetrahydrodipicolinate synthase
MGAMQLLTDGTFRQALEVASDEVKGRIPVIAGCGDCSTERTLERIRWAERSGIDAVALVPPFFFKFTSNELFNYFRELSEKSRIPVYLYDNPAFTKHSLDLSLIAQLALLPNVHGVKMSGDLLTFRLCAEKYRESEHFVVLSGQTCFCDLSLQLGASGIVEGLFAIAPELGVCIWNSVKAGDYAAAALYQRRLTQLVDVVRVDSLFGGFTAAMNLRGIPGNFAARPFTQITEEGRARVKAILKELALLPEEARNDRRSNGKDGGKNER